MNKYIVSTIISVAMAGMGVAQLAGAQTVPVIVSLPATPTRVQIQHMALTDLATQLNAGVAPLQALTLAGQQLVSQLNQPTALFPNGNTITLPSLAGPLGIAAATLNVSPTAVQAFMAQLFITQPPVVTPPVVTPPVVTPPVVTPPIVTPPVVTAPAPILRPIPVSIGNFTTSAANAPGNTTPITETGLTFQAGSTAFPPTLVNGVMLPTLAPVPTLTAPPCRPGTVCPTTITVRDLAASELAAQLNAGLTPLQAAGAIAESFAAEMTARNIIPFLGSQMVPSLDAAAKSLLAPTAVNGIITPGTHIYQNPTFLANENARAQTFLAQPITSQPVVLTTNNEAAALQAALANQALIDGQATVTPPVVTPPVVTPPVVIPPVVTPPVVTPPVVKPPVVTPPVVTPPVVTPPVVTPPVVTPPVVTPPIVTPPQNNNHGGGQNNNQNNGGGQNNGNGGNNQSGGQSNGSKGGK
jgi:hypothetical protein